MLELLIMLILEQKLFDCLSVIYSFLFYFSSKKFKFSRSFSLNTRSEPLTHKVVQYARVTPESGGKALYDYFENDVGANHLSDITDNDLKC